MNWIIPPPQSRTLMTSPLPKEPLGILQTFLIRL